MLPVDSSFTHAIAPTPAGPVEDRRSFLFLSTNGGLPCRCIRSAPALSVSRLARRSLTLWPACLLTPQGSFFRECFSPIRYLLEPLQVLPVGATSDRAGFAPAGINTPFTAHTPLRLARLAKSRWVVQPLLIRRLANCRRSMSPPQSVDESAHDAVSVMMCSNAIGGCRRRSAINIQ